MKDFFLKYGNKLSKLVFLVQKKKKLKICATSETAISEQNICRRFKSNESQLITTDMSEFVSNKTYFTPFYIL